MFITKLGIRNLFRHKKRTVITSILISLAILIFLVTGSLMGGLTELSFDNIINLQSGHLEIANPAYWDKRKELPMENMMVVNDKLKNEIQSMDNYQAMAEELRFSARLNNGIDELPVTGLGVRVSQQKEVFTTENYMIKGKFFEPGKYQTIIGQSMAELMDLSIGDYITLLVKTEDGTFNTIDLEITGLLKTPNPTINNGTVYLPLEIAQQSLNLGNKISQIAVRLNINKHNINSVVENLNRSLKDTGFNLQAYSWEKSAEEIIVMSQAQKFEMTVILSIILLIAAVGIINTTILAALERIEEIGMMKALGLREREIVWTFMVEAAGIGIVGGLIGSVLSIGAIYYMAVVGIPFSAFGGEDMAFGLPILDTIYGTWDISSFIFIFVFGVVVAVLASILPARWAARKDPIKAIYHK